MTEANHTPGPWDWVIHDHSMASLGVLPDPGLGDPLVLSIGPCKACAERAHEAGKQWEWGRCNTPSEADARLISAAPDLYAALIETLAIATRNEDGEFADRARAAIAKAEGLAP